MEREDALGDSGDDDEGGFPERIWAVLKDREATQTGCVRARWFVLKYCEAPQTRGVKSK